MKISIKTILTCALWIIAFESVSFASARITNSNIKTWYATLTAPPLVPPNWVFPVAWSVLYALIACAGFLLWQRGEKRLLILFFTYMALNWSWSFVYFGLHMMLAGLIEIIVMNALLITLIMKSWRPVKPAAMLLIPLLLWSLFATYLNAGYWWLNH
ncbi:MAG: hypothetical protein JWP32_2996 [Schumannella sp.]|nr:hypothetical protein [Schumannella sp.]